MSSTSFAQTKINSSQIRQPLTLGNINSILTVDGVTYTTLAAAFAACPTGPSGCTIDMRGNSASAALSLGTFDPGNIAVTIYLGPFSYTVNQITLRPNLRIYGTAAFFGIQSQPQTSLTATGGNATPPFILAQVAGVQNVFLADFALQCAGGNTSQNGFNLIAPNGGGLWNSEFDNIQVNGCAGIGMNFDSQTNGAIHQFDTFRRVGVFRTLNGNFALQVIGRANSLTFDACEFDGQFNTQDGKTNINIAEGTNTVGIPYNIRLPLLTSQYAGIGIHVIGGDSVVVDEPHFEQVEGVLLCDSGSNFGCMNVTMHDGGAFTNSGIGTVAGLGIGNGYIVKNGASTVNASINIISFHSFNTPDAFFRGNTGSIVSLGNTVGPEGAYTFQPFTPQASATVTALSTNSLLLSSTSPGTVTGFNTGAISNSNGSNAFLVTVGVGGAVSTGTIALPTTTNGWVCFAQNQTRADYIQQTGNTVSSVTFTNFGTAFGATNWTNGDQIFIGCLGR